MAKKAKKDDEALKVDKGDDHRKSGTCAALKALRLKRAFESYEAPVLNWAAPDKGKRND